VPPFGVAVLIFLWEVPSRQIISPTFRLNGVLRWAPVVVGVYVVKSARRFATSSQAERRLDMLYAFTSGALTCLVLTTRVCILLWAVRKCLCFNLLS